MDWQALIKTVAPWIGTALGGPLGGLAVEAAANALGISEKTTDAVKQALAGVTPEQMLALKQADQQFQAKMQELGFTHIEKLADLEFKDRDSARNREIQTKDNTNKIIAFVIIGAFIAMVGATLMGWTKAESVLAGTLIGYLSAKAEQVLAYYFGSTSGSNRKTELLAKSTPAKE